jgi:hypothetical protein
MSGNHRSSLFAAACLIPARGSHRDIRDRAVHDGDARLIHAAHRHVERGAAGLRFEGPDFRPADR